VVVVVVVVVADEITPATARATGTTTSTSTVTAASTTMAEVGYHLPGGPLIEQANATKTLALADMAAFKTEGLLSEADITNLDGLIGEVHKGLEDRTVATSETRAQTAGQATAMRALKIDRRRLGHCVDRAFRGRPDLAQYRQSCHHGTSVAATCNDMNIKLAFAKELQAKLSPVGVTAAFLAKVEAEVRALEQSSGAQEAAIAQLPASHSPEAPLACRCSSGDDLVIPFSRRSASGREFDSEGTSRCVYRLGIEPSLVGRTGPANEGSETVTWVRLGAHAEGLLGETGTAQPGQRPRLFVGRTERLGSSAEFGGLAEFLLGAQRIAFCKMNLPQSQGGMGRESRVDTLSKNSLIVLGRQRWAVEIEVVEVGQPNPNLASMRVAWQAQRGHEVNGLLEFALLVRFSVG